MRNRQQEGERGKERERDGENFCVNEKQTTGGRERKRERDG